MNSQADSLKAEADALDSELRLTLERSQYYELTTWVREEEAAVAENLPPPPRSLIRTDRWTDCGRHESWPRRSTSGRS